MLWAEFNDIDERGRTDCLTDGDTYTPGQTVVVGDHEGNRCPGQVEAVNGDLVAVALDLNRFAGR